MMVQNPSILQDFRQTWGPRGQKVETESQSRPVNATVSELDYKLNIQDTNKYKSKLIQRWPVYSVKYSLFWQIYQSPLILVSIGLTAGPSLLSKTNLPVGLAGP